MGVTEIVCQGIVCSTNTPKVPSDDPDQPGPEDPTVTPLDPPQGIADVPISAPALIALTLVLAFVGCMVTLRRPVAWP